MEGKTPKIIENAEGKNLHSIDIGASSLNRITLQAQEQRRP